MSDNSLFTTGARRHLRLLLRSIRPLADRLDRIERRLDIAEASV